MIGIDLEEFLQGPSAIFDVRSPSEFQQGHIPGTHSLPLFSDHERAAVGTAYKQQGREQAIDLGLQIVGPRLLELVQSVRGHSAMRSGKQANILCWRGGMRSGFVARMLEGIGIRAVTLRGGYKTFRRSVLNIFEQLVDPLPSLRVIGGLTGCNKTGILEELSQLGEQVIDLEKLASHRGSAFGAIGLTSQPSSEQFENLLARQLRQLDLSRPIWIEDESRLIGRCRIPSKLYQLMQSAQLICLERPFDERMEQLMLTYGCASPDLLIASTLQLSKRLGAVLTKEIAQEIAQGSITAAFAKLLSYYDKRYHFQLERRQRLCRIAETGLSARQWALALRNCS